MHDMHSCTKLLSRDNHGKAMIMHYRTEKQNYGGKPAPNTPIDPSAPSAPSG